MFLPKELVDRMVKWEPDEKGNCRKECSAFSSNGSFCENMAMVIETGKPCPILRIRVGLGRERL